jgi:hypothetical protein
MTEAPRQDFQKDRSMDRINEALESARSGSAWLPWTGLGLALIWWAAAGGFAWFHFGMDALMSFSPPLLLISAMLILMPGLLIIVAATMAAEQRRSARANAVVLQAAGQLLHPARAVAGEGVMLADAMKTVSRGIESEVRRATEAMNAASTQLGDERMRIESVSYACADNARDLSERLTEERRALETLARELRSQLDGLNEAIPRQAELMVESARRAAGEIAEADRALEHRLERMNAANQSMIKALGEIDALSADAGRRQQGFSQQVGELAGELKSARSVTEQALKVTEMATQGARDAGSALEAAVAQAIEKAHRAALDIQAEAREAMKRTDEALANMRASAAAAKSAAAELGVPVRTDAEPDTVQPVHAPAEPPRIHRAVPDLPAKPLGADDLFDDTFDETGPAPQQASQAAADPFDPSDEAPADLPSEPSAPPPSFNGNGSSLRDILADIDRAEAPLASQPLDSGIALVERLSASGIALPRIFRTRDTKKLAQAAREGGEALRRTVQDLAGDEVHRVAVRLSKDGGLMGLARDFIGQDGIDILNALAAREKTADASQPRVSAFLLVDAALNQAEGRL